MFKYQCSKCNVTECKLWRESYVFLEHVHLLCANCAAESEKVNISSIDHTGRRLIYDFDKDVVGRRTDQIGFFVPAVPTDDGYSFWGYTSVPEEGITWWRNLPTLPK